MTKISKHDALASAFMNVVDQLEKALLTATDAMKDIPKTIPYDKTEVMKRMGEKHVRALKAEIIDWLTMSAYVDADSSDIVIYENGVQRNFTQTESYFNTQRRVVAQNKQLLE